MDPHDLMLRVQQFIANVKIANSNDSSGIDFLKLEAEYLLSRFHDWRVNSFERDRNEAAPQKNHEIPVAITPLAQRCIDELNVALKEFGSHDFFDRGPDEVMDVCALSKKFRKAGVDMAVQSFKDISQDDEHGEILICAILQYLEDWDELWDNHGDLLRSYWS